MANIVTGVRIILSISLLFCAPFSVPFYALYIIAGFSDMIDGAIARKTNTVSELGSLSDTAADFILFAVCLIKLLPVLDIDAIIYVWIAIIAIIKTASIAFGVIAHKRIIAVHSVMNKITGALLFALPLTARIIDIRYSMTAVCAAATFAAVQEWHYIGTFKNTEPHKGADGKI